MIQERKSDLEKKWNKDLEQIKENGKEKAKVCFLEGRMIKKLSDLQMEEIFNFIDSWHYNRYGKSLSGKIENIIDKFGLPTQEELHNKIKEE